VYYYMGFDIFAGNDRSDPRAQQENNRVEEQGTGDRVSNAPGPVRIRVIEKKIQFRARRSGRQHAW